jgi:hypothetical protein
VTYYGGVEPLALACRVRDSFVRTVKVVEGKWAKIDRIVESEYRRPGMEFLLHPVWLKFVKLAGEPLQRGDFIISDYVSPHI